MLNLWSRGPGRIYSVENMKRFWTTSGTSRRTVTGWITSAIQKPWMKNELEGMKIACDAIMILGRTLRCIRQRLAEKRTIKRREGCFVTANCDVVPAHKPQTYWQAIQMYWISCIWRDRALNRSGCIQPGSLEPCLNPFMSRM